MSSNQDSPAVPSEAVFSLVSITFHFDTSTNGTIASIQDVSGVFHKKLELASTLHQRRTVINNNLEALRKAQIYILDEVHRQSKLLLRL
jgi:hypothetical protein